ncbi:unnamed protein product [Somion occarium]|uniref:Uncharacterized protein n=1 Tax=Somion occarium TaxID=3059160 RepID=A0ABP1CZU2_9APHY
MSSAEDILLFDLPGSKEPRTTRKLHIRRLYDILQLCILRQDFVRARKAWAILVRCKEVHWKALWKTGVLLLGGVDDEPDHEQENGRRIDYLYAMMRLQKSHDRESVLQELILRLIKSGQHRKALDELELYLPSPPYEDNPILHIYAGLLCLYLSQGQQDSDIQYDDRQAELNASMLRDAQVFFERARVLDPENEFASSWIERIPSLSQQQSNDRRDTPDSDEEGETITTDNSGQRTKRIRREETSHSVRLG